MKKKLSKAARKKESTGINNEARKKEIAELELRVSRLELIESVEKEQLKKIMKYFQSYFIKRKK